MMETNQGHNYLEISQEFYIFASSNHKTMTKEEIFRKKAPHYLVCFIGQRPPHGSCLRWFVGCEAPTDTLMLPNVIKHQLISMHSRKTYYDYRKGTRLIAPDIQAQIKQVCQEEG